MYKTLLLKKTHMSNQIDENQFQFKDPRISKCQERLIEKWDDMRLVFVK